MSISEEDQLQYVQVRTYWEVVGEGRPSGARRVGSGGLSMLVMARGDPIQMGHWKQLRVHLDGWDEG